MYESQGDKGCIETYYTKWGHRDQDSLVPRPFPFLRYTWNTSARKNSKNGKGQGPL